MIDLYYWTTPNGHKITLFLEEANLEYQIIPINIGQGDQFSDFFLSFSPNNRIPAIIDHTPAQSSTPISLFESGAILIYLAEKTSLFYPTEQRYTILQWLMWQMGGLGPMLGQNHHFNSYAAEKIPYAISRYKNETKRLYAVLNKQLENQDYICGDYSIADMACYPWTIPYELQGIDINQYPNVQRWMQIIAQRPAVQRAYAKGKAINVAPTVDKDAAKILFGQTDTSNPAQ